MSGTYLAPLRAVALTGSDDQRPSFCLGMNRWKRESVAALLRSPSVPEPEFVRFPEEAVARARATQGRVIIWASKASARLRWMCAEAGVPLWYMEDGFLRSRGLG